MKSTDLKERLVSAVPLEAYIGRHVHLKKAGRYFKGLCPFHSEKTPSFTVTPEKGLYHCFGCGKGGDLFRFVMDLEGVDFSGALDILCSFAGIERSEFTSGRKGPDDTLARLNAKVLAAFREFLASPDAEAFRHYLSERGIKPETAENFQIGAAPNRWDFISNRFLEQHKNLIELGVLRKKEGVERPYDFYRGRIIFPIQDLAGRVLGFGGRILPHFNESNKQVAKYINSADSRLYHKSQVLYGLPLATSAIRQAGTCFLVEGYLDVIGLHQVGVANCVASLGTAFTNEQMRLLSRYTNRIVALFDGDTAGRAAAVKFSRLALEFPELDCGIVLLPAGHDPFDISMQWPVIRLKELLETLIQAERFFILETMFPNLGLNQLDEALHTSSRTETGFADQNPIENNLRVLRNLQAYYAGDRPDLLPGGSQKRPGLNRLYQALSELSSQTDRQFLLEDAAQILRLDSKEVLREMQARVEAQHQKRPHDRQLNPGMGKEAAKIPIYQDFPVQKEKEPSDLRVEADPLSQRMGISERALISEFVFHPGLAGEYLDPMAELVFEDMHAEILWRYLEARLLTGNLWHEAEFQSFAIPAGTREVFNRSVLEFQAAGASENARAQQVIIDLLLHLRILKLEKSIAEFDASHVVADSVEQKQIIDEWQVAVNTLRHLKAKRRGLD